jgi:hypothetical protein
VKSVAEFVRRSAFAVRLPDSKAARLRGEPELGAVAASVSICEICGRVRSPFSVRRSVPDSKAPRLRGGPELGAVAVSVSICEICGLGLHETCWSFRIERDGSDH